jgi:hypothetical protein
MHLLDSALPLQSLSLLAEPGLHLAPHVDEPPLYDLELPLTLRIEFFPLGPMLLLQ